MRLVIDIPDKDYEFVRDIFAISGGRMSYKGVQANVINAIKHGTPYNAERPQGKWIEHYSKEMSEKGYYLCSRCKCGFQRFERGVRHSDLPWIDGQKYELHCIDNFCPNCGADMRGIGIKNE